MNKSQLIKIARKVQKLARNHWHDNDLCGMCGIASVILHKFLEEAGIYASIVCNNEHAFVEYNDYIIDVTATQYEYTDVVCIKRSSFKDSIPSYWQTKQVFDNRDKFIQYQKEVGWPHDQIYNEKKYGK